MSVFSADESGTIVGIVLLDDDRAVEYVDIISAQLTLQSVNRQVTLGAVPNVPPLSEIARLIYQNTSDDVLFDDYYPVEFLDVLIEIPPVIYTITPSGEIVYSGTAPITFVPAGGVIYTITPSGSINFSGAAPLIREEVLAPSGSLSFSGSASNLRVRTQPTSGSIVFSGSPIQFHTRVSVPSGQIVFEGSAGITFVSGGGGSGTAGQRTLIGVGI